MYVGFWVVMSTRSPYFSLLIVCYYRYLCPLSTVIVHVISGPRVTIIGWFCLSEYEVYLVAIVTCLKSGQGRVGNNIHKVYMYCKLCSYVKIGNFTSMIFAISGNFQHHFMSIGTIFGIQILPLLAIPGGLNLAIFIKFAKLPN